MRLSVVRRSDDGEPEIGETPLRRASFSRLCAFTLAALVLLPGRGAAREASSTQLAPRLATLARGADRVVLVRVGTLNEVDEGRLLQARLQVSKTLRSTDADTPGGDLDVIEERRFPSVPATLRAGMRAIVFLELATPTSQMRRALPGGTYYRLANGRWGLLDLSDGTTEPAALELVTGWIDLAEGINTGELDEPAQAQLRRRLVFLGLGATNARLVEDGVASLPELRGIAGNLRNDERATIERVLGREDLPDRVRIGLVNTIASMKIRSLAPALYNLSGAGPDLRRATIRARATLGEARDRKVLVDDFGADDPAVRLAAVEELSETGTDAAVAEIAALAREDQDRGVRLAAIEALGTSSSPVALEALGTIFKETDPEIRRQAARSIHAIGNRDAARLLSNLAFEAPPDAQRQAVVLLLTLDIPRTDPLVMRIREQHPSAALRELAERGIDTHSH